jgi:hypothetical protein
MDFVGMVNTKSQKNDDEKYDLKLRLNESDILNYAKSWSYSKDEKIVLNLIKPIIKQQFITQDQLITISEWKSDRNTNAARNDPAYVKEITKWCFSTKNERAKIEVLNILDGVDWPTASFILHLYHSDDYPVIDVRALWTCNMNPKLRPNYNFWNQYCLFVRGIQDRTGLDMRTIDKGLWQYSKQHQEKLS